MHISWHINDVDVQRVKKILNDNNNIFLKKRKEHNVLKKNIVIDHNTIIKTMIACLLTSQQRSGPHTPVSNFLNLNPFPITHQKMKSLNNISLFTKEILAQNGLTRFIERISKFFSKNIIAIQKDYRHSKG